MELIKWKPYSYSRLDHANCPWSFAQEYIRRMEDDLREPGSFRDAGNPRIALPRITKNRRAEIERILGSIKYELEPVVPEGTTPQNLVFGHSIHSIFENIVKAFQNGEKPMVSDIIQKYTDKSLYKADPKYDFHAVQELVDRFMENAGRIDRLYELECNLAIDENKVATEYEDSNALVRVRLDVLETDTDSKEARITDYKTNWNIFDADDSFQLRLYAWVVVRCFGFIEKVRVQYYFARYGTMRNYDFTRAELDKVGEEVDFKINAIESITDFTKAQRCSYCSICPWALSKCPALATERALKIDSLPTTNDEAVALWGKLMECSDRADDIKEKLRKYCADNGKIITIPGKAMGFRERTEYDYPTDKFLDLAYEFSVKDLDKYLDVKNTEINKLLKVCNDKELKEKLEGLRVKTTKTEFRNFKN